MSTEQALPKDPVAAADLLTALILMNFNKLIWV